MTVQEFSNQFDILYDSIASKDAPGIDEYEKSVYLTKAQLEIVKEYNGTMNKYRKSFDETEKRKIDLKELIKDYKTTSSYENANSITSNELSRFYPIPDDVFLIKYERGVFNPKGNCKTLVDILPVTLDTLKEALKNPFRKPSDVRAWRLDFNTETFNENVVEIISKLPLDVYEIRYIKFPDPIILADLDSDEFNGENLTINGQVIAQTCKLNEEIHPEILDRAVELAILDYNVQKLQTKVQINSRNN